MIASYSNTDYNYSYGTNAGWYHSARVVRSYLSRCDVIAALNFAIAQAESWKAVVDSAFERYKTPHAILPTRIFMGVKKFFRRNFQPRWSRLRWRSTT